MPQFHFRVLTPDGKTRSGRLHGNSAEEARKHIQAKGLTVLELTLLEASSSERFFKLKRLGPRISGYQLASLLACCGLACGLLSWSTKSQSSSPAAPARDALAMAQQPFHGEFRGQFAGSQLANAVVVFDFPEITYRVTRPWPTSASGCTCKVEFLAQRYPSFCLVTLQQGNSVVASARLEPLKSVNVFQFKANEKAKP